MSETMAPPQPAETETTAAAEPASDPDRNPLANGLMHLNVNVVVRLAQKRIELGQLLALSPGTLVTFNKSCDAPLELFVNNRPYCRGEAIKVGERFGLKINEMWAGKE